MAIKLVQVNSESFTSSYDLLQVIPVKLVDGGDICCGAGGSLQADMNYDGVTEYTDAGVPPATSRRRVTPSRMRTGRPWWMTRT